MSESESAISPVIKNKAGRKPKEVWSFFTTTGEKKEGHQGCKCKYCPWSQTRGEPNSMEAHLAVSCHKVPNDIKEKFLLIVKTRGEKRTFQLDAEVSVLQTKKRKAGHQQLITKYGESDIIENAKQQICDRAVAKFFICCGVSFRLVEHPFFIDMVKSLCLGYNPPCANVLSNDFLYAELANVIVDQHLELKSTRNLTLGFDGWTSPLGQSLYAFVIMTPERKEIIHCIKNLSANSHTATFLADQLDEVITEVGAEKFAAVVSDHASACAAAKRIIAERHNHILPIRCIAHHVNLISTDICKTTFAKEVISKCQKVVKYFKQSHQAGEELREKVNEIKGGGLKTYVVTRWTTAWDCTNSILRLEQALKNILDENPEKLSTDVSELIRKRSFFTDVEAVNTLLGPIKSVIKSLEFKTTTLADCFVELIKLSQKIKSLPPVSDYDFKYQCVELFNKRWQEFDIQLYILAYLLHPHYRGKGLRPNMLRNVYILAMKLWVNMGGGEHSSGELVSQIQSFYLKSEEYDIPFITKKGDVLRWWRLCNPVHSAENHIQKLALKILSITPHNAGCERVFSVLGWFANKRRTKLKVEKLDAMAKLHTHYITNTKKELKYAYVGLSETDFQTSVQEAFSDANASDGLDEDEDEDVFFDDDSDDDNDNEGDDRDSNTPSQRDTEIENWVDINDAELKKLLNIEVNVVIDTLPIPVINHGSNEFDIEAAVDKVLGTDT